MRHRHADKNKGPTSSVRLSQLRCADGHSVARLSGSLLPSFLLSKLITTWRRRDILTFEVSLRRLTHGGARARGEGRHSSKQAPLTHSQRQRFDVDLPCRPSRPVHYVQTDSALPCFPRIHKLTSYLACFLGLGRPSLAGPVYAIKKGKKGLRKEEGHHWGWALMGRLSLLNKNI